MRALRASGRTGPERDSAVDAGTHGRTAAIVAGVGAAAALATLAARTRTR
jgi:hypothetical protein